MPLIYCAHYSEQKFSNAQNTGRPRTTGGDPDANTCYDHTQLVLLRPLFGDDSGRYRHLRHFIWQD